MKPYFSYGVNLPASNRDLVTSTIKYEGATKRYFSSIDAEIYIEGERILDINRLDYSYEEKKLPIYGFNSFIPSSILIGQKIIQGTFIINFTRPGYIAELIHNGDGSQIDNKYAKVGISCDVNNSALFKKSFDIVIGYGGHNIAHEDSYRSTYQVLRGVYINGYQQILDTSGEPIYEVYSFIARNLSFESASAIYGAGYNEYKENKENKEAEEIVPTEPEITEEETEDSGNGSLASVKVRHAMTTHRLSKISVIFPTMYTLDIQSVRVTISDNQIDMSRSYLLNKKGNEWEINLDIYDTAKINKKLTSTSKTMNVALEVQHKKADNTIKALTRNVKMYKVS